MMTGQEARRAWHVADRELHAIRDSIKQIEIDCLGTPAMLLRSMLPDAQRRTDEAFGRMQRIEAAEDEERWTELQAKARSFVPPDDNPIWTMNLSAPVKRGRGRPRKVGAA